MANAIYLISKDMILADYKHLLKNSLYKHLNNIDPEDVHGLKEIINIPSYKILSQISFTDLIIFNHEQIVAGYKELKTINSKNKAFLKLKHSFEVALAHPLEYMLIDY